MAQTAWSGAVSFGPVNVCRMAVAATGGRAVRFIQLQDMDGEPVRMKRTCLEHTEVPSDEVVKACPVPPTEYLIVEQVKLAGVAPEESRPIDVEPA